MASDAAAEGVGAVMADQLAGAAVKADQAVDAEIAMNPEGIAKAAADTAEAAKLTGGKWNSDVTMQPDAALATHLKEIFARNDTNNDNVLDEKECEKLTQTVFANQRSDLCAKLVFNCIEETRHHGSNKFSKPLFDAAVANGVTDLTEENFDQGFCQKVVKEILEPHLEKELKKSYQDMLIGLGELDATGQSGYKRIFTTLDSDGDGRVSGQELIENYVKVFSVHGTLLKQMGEFIRKVADNAMQNAAARLLPYYRDPAWVTKNMKDADHEFASPSRTDKDGCNILKVTMGAGEYNTLAWRNKPTWDAKVADYGLGPCVDTVVVGPQVFGELPADPTFLKYKTDIKDGIKDVYLYLPTRDRRKVGHAFDDSILDAHQAVTTNAEAPVIYKTMVITDTPSNGGLLPWLTEANAASVIADVHYPGLRKGMVLQGEFITGGADGGGWFDGDYLKIEMPERVDPATGIAMPNFMHVPVKAPLKGEPRDKVYMQEITLNRACRVFTKAQLEKYFNKSGVPDGVPYYCEEALAAAAKKARAEHAAKKDEASVLKAAEDEARNFLPQNDPYLGQLKTAVKQQLYDKKDNSGCCVIA